MKKFNLLRRSERKSVGTTLALTVGSPSAHRRYSALKHLTFMLLFLLGSLNVWGAKVDITSLGTQSWSSYSLTSGVVTVSTDLGTGQAPTTSNAQYRWKTGNVITIEVASGNVISSIQFKTNSSATYGPRCLSYNSSAITNDGTDYTWEAPSSISSASFSVTSEARLTEIHVTYAAGSGSGGTGGGSGSGDGGYVLVENSNQIGAGDYLIVYNNAYALNTHNGNANANTYGTYTDVSSYYTSSTKTIASNTTTDALAYEVSESTNGYTIKRKAATEYLGYNNTQNGSYLRWDGSITASQNEWTLGVNSIVSVYNDAKAIRWNNSANPTRFAIYATDGQSAIQLFKKVSTATVEKPTISVGEEYFLNSTTVTLGCTTDGATIYYTLDDTDPKTSVSKQTYSTEFSINASGATKIRAIAKKDDDWSDEATSKTVNKLAAITPAEALTIISALDNKTATTRNYLVAGTICESPAPSVTENSYATYYISADGSTTSQLQVYKGKYIGGANFTLTDQIQAGDDVTIVGKLKKYNTNSELDENNEIVTFYPKARLSWSAESYTASLVGSNTFPTLTNTNGVAVTYSSSNSSVASFTDASDYSTLTLNAAGTDVTISATFEGNSTYKANTVTYTLNVEAAVERGKITFDVDGGNAIDPVADATELPNPLPIPTKAGKNFVAWYTNPGKTDEAVAGAAVTEDITLYAKWREPYSVTEALAIIATYGNNEGGANDVYVAGIVSTAPSSNPNSGRLTYSISADGTASDEIKVYLGKGVDDAPFTNKTDVQLDDKVVVYGKLYKYEKNSEITPEVNTPNHLYSFSRKAEAELDWSASSAVVGITGDKDYPAIMNPHSVAGIRYSSSDPTVASFADENAYAITLHKAGTVTITATFDGDEAYKNDEASYTLEVRDVLVYVTITYDCDGATTGCPDPATIENQTNLPNLLPTVTKDGFKFGGWFTNAGKTEAATAGAALTDNVTLYAKWIEIPTFDNSGYEWQLVTSDAQLVANQYYVMGRAANSAVASNTLSSGYLSKVAVTYTDDGIAYNGFATAPTTKTANEAGVAVFLLGGNSTDGWTLTEVLGAETGLLGGAGSTSFAWGGNYTVWPITIDGSGEAVIGTASAERVLYNVSSPRFKPYGAGTQTSTNMPLPQLYVWAEKTFKLRYDANEGTNAPTATPATAGKAVVTDAKPTAPTGKIFDGWNENASGTGANYAAGDEVTVSGADVTIYAKWRDPVDYTVSYNANGGTLMEGKSDIDPQDITEGHQVTVAANVYEKEGFVFGGWKYGENIYSANQKFTMPAENVELVALWASLNVTDFVLVTDVKQLKDGDKVYIVAAESDNALGAYNTNYRDRVAIQKSADKSHVVLINIEPVELTVGKDGDFFTFHDGTGYLCTTSGSSNYMGREATLTDEGKWDITISEEEGVVKATIIAQGTNSRKDMRYNASSGQERFSCYATNTTMKAVSIYKRPDYSRNVSGNYGTICLPKAGKIYGASLYEIAYFESSSSKIFFDEIVNGEMEAGIPYIFLPAAGVENIGVYYSDNTATDVAAGNHNGLYGSYTQEVLGTGGNNYILLNNQYCQVTNANVSVGANRAYIKLNEVPGTAVAPAPGRRRISMSVQNEQVATGLENGEANEAPRKVLINGELFILRGEKMYNANGQIVK